MTVSKLNRPRAFIIIWMVFSSTGFTFMILTATPTLYRSDESVCPSC